MAPKARRLAVPGGPAGRHSSNPSPNGSRRPSKQAGDLQEPSRGSPEDRARRLQALGNTLLKLNRVPRAVSAYHAADATTVSNDLRIVLTSSLAAAMLQMLEPALVREFVDHGFRDLRASGAAAARLRRHVAAAEKLEGPDFSDEELKVHVERGEKFLQEADFISAKKGYGLLAGAYKQDEPPEKEENEGDEEDGGFSLGQVGRSAPAPDKDGSWLAAICRVALTNLKLELVDVVLETSSQGLAWADEVGPISDMTPPKMCRTLRMLKVEANLLREIVANYQSSLQLTSTRPTVFTPMLAEAVFTCNAGQFFAGQFLEAEYAELEGQAEDVWLQKLCVKKKYGMHSSSVESAPSSRRSTKKKGEDADDNDDVSDDDRDDDRDEVKEENGEREERGKERRAAQDSKDSRRQLEDACEHGLGENLEDPEELREGEERIRGGENPEESHGEACEVDLNVDAAISESSRTIGSDRSHRLREDGQDASGEQTPMRRKRTATPPNILRPRRFLVTVNAVTSIVVFAWARCPGARSATRAFGAHVPLQALLHGLMRRQIRRHASRHPLEELAKSLHEAFRGIPAEAVEFHILGGHEHEDTNEDSSLAKVFFPDEPEKQRFSWHVFDALREAGFARSGVVINSVLLNAFPGRRIGSQAVEREVMRENQYLACAALDVETGNVVTQTEHPQESATLVPPSWRLAERENSVLYDDNTMQPMRRSIGGDDPSIIRSHPPVFAASGIEGSLS